MSPDLRATSPQTAGHTAASSRANAIAIVGMSGRFPGAPDLHTFWRNLTGGVEALTPLTDDELRASGVPDELINHPDYVKRVTYLEDAGHFDAAFFGFNAREAEILDPQQRVFLECAWESLEDAGYAPDQYPGAVGVFAGASINTYLIANLLANPAVLETMGGYQIMVANDKDFLATRVNYKLNLRGPGVTVQTACSTSLVAVQMAWQSLINRQCDLALAGGVSIAFPQKAGYLYREGMIFSPDGHCRPFDAKGQGIRAGAGAGVVALKRLDDAIADRDPIRAVILGAAINNDGSDKMGYTAPSVDGQAAVVALAQREAGVNPETISYIEAHGTATSLGDPIEVAALSQVFQARTARRNFCALGSLKSNLGHLDAAAGVAGLIKTVLSLEHKTLPPSINFTEPNPQIDFVHSPFYVNDTLSEWKSGETPRRAGVSSFGIGGTNSHVILEEAPAREASRAARPVHVLVLSARTPAALDAAANNLSYYLEAHPNVSLADVAYTLQVGRTRFEYRRAIVCRDHAEAIVALRGAKGASNANLQDAPPVAFLFSGQGSQYAGMGRELYDTEPTFREVFDDCADRLQPHLGRDIRALVLTPVAEGAEPEINETQFAQPALFVFEYALARTWMAWGIRPSAMLGHSIGEYVAACLAGVLSLDDALRLVAERGRLMQSMPSGRMLAIPLPAADVTPLLGDQLSLAAVNAPRLCVVAGPVDAVTTLERRLSAQGIECRALHTSHAFHSAMMEPMLPAFQDTLRGVALHPPTIPYLSNLTGTWITDAEATQADYWARHLRSAVRFADGVQELSRIDGLVFLEVGPGKTLATLARQTLGATAHEILQSSPHPLDKPSDLDVLFTGLGRLWAAGASVHWDAVHRGEQLYRVSLPTYPFERQRYFVEPQRTLLAAAPLQKRSDVGEWFYAPLWKQVPSALDTGASLIPDASGAWLIFLDDHGIGARIAARITAAGHRCYTVQPGSSYSADGTRYTVRPNQRDDYEKLVSHVLAQGVPLRRVVHLWSVTDGESSSYETTLDRGLFSLVHLAQGILASAFMQRIDVTVVTTGLQRVLGDEVLDPYKAFILGPSIVMPFEMPSVRCQSIDIALAGADDALIDTLVADAEQVGILGAFAYRLGKRWAETFEPMPLPARDGTPPQLRERGVYFITGGLGGLGAVVATFLAQTVHARLVLTGRSALPPRAEWPQWLASHDERDATSRRIRLVQELEAAGAEVLVVAADVSDRGAMTQAVAQARQQFGVIHGVFHIAGLPGGAILPLHTQEGARQVLSAKVGGTQVLDAIFQNEPLDCFVLFSSINTMLGYVGTTDYTAANAFLDRYAMIHSTPQRRILAINWDAWRDAGMLADMAAAAGHPDAFVHGIERQEGVEALKRLFGTSLPRVAVVTREWNALREFIRPVEVTSDGRLALPDPAGGESALSQHARPSLAQEFVAPQTDHERFIAVVWQELLGIDRVGIDDNFFELGGHSLLATGMLARIQQEWGVKLPLRTIFEAPTVRELADRVSALTWAMKPADALQDDASREEFEI